MPEPGWRRALEKLGPYQSLILLAIPLCIVEPLKRVAVAIAGKGHWMTGTKLLTLEWFARIWTCFVTLRERAAGWFLSWTGLSQARSDGR